MNENDEMGEALPSGPDARDRQSGTDRYFVDLDTGMVHTKDSHGRSYESDNLDKSTNLTEVPSREQINEVLGGKRAKACRRCFVSPTAKEREMFNSSPRSGTRTLQAQAGKVDTRNDAMAEEDYDAIEAAGAADAPLSEIEALPDREGAGF